MKDLGRWAPARDHLMAAADLFREAGDVHSAAHAERVCAEIDRLQGRPDVALDRLRHHLLPLFEQLGDARSIALVQGQIADVLEARGELDEALRIRREEELPVFERLGDVRSLIVGRVNLALTLLNRGREENGKEIREHLLWAYQAASERGYQEAGQIADLLRRLGLPVQEDAAGEGMPEGIETDVPREGDRG